MPIVGGGPGGAFAVKNGGALGGGGAFAVKDGGALAGGGALVVRYSCMEAWPMFLALMGISKPVAYGVSRCITRVALRVLHHTQWGSLSRSPFLRIGFQHSQCPSVQLSQHSVQPLHLHSIGGKR